MSPHYYVLVRKMILTKARNRISRYRSVVRINTYNNCTYISMYIDWQKIYPYFSDRTQVEINIRTWISIHLKWNHGTLYVLQKLIHYVIRTYVHRFDLLNYLRNRSIQKIIEFRMRTVHTYVAIHNYFQFNFFQSPDVYSFESVRYHTLPWRTNNLSVDSISRLYFHRTVA